jgi:hypothetical protein
MRLAEHLARMDGMRGAHKDLLEKLGRRRRKWEDNTKMYLQDV